MRKITVHNPNNLPTIDYRKLRVLQGDLKTLSEENLHKLCNSILKHGFFIPAFVWRSSDDLWILDATQRYHALSELEKQGYVIPEIPYVKIEAKDKEDAAEKLLQITSRYGIINENTSFFKDFDIDLSFINEIEIPELIDVSVIDDVKHDNDNIDVDNHQLYQKNKYVVRFGSFLTYIDRTEEFEEFDQLILQNSDESFSDVNVEIAMRIMALICQHKNEILHSE